MDHYDIAQGLLATASPYEPHKYQQAVGHALLALLDKLDEIPIMVMTPVIEDQEED